MRHASTVFENKTDEVMSIASFATLLSKLLDYMEAAGLGAAKIFWQGGEILTMDPAWFDEALGLINRQAEERGLRIDNELQTNLVGYSPAGMRLWTACFGINWAHHWISRICTVNFPEVNRKNSILCG